MKRNLIKLLALLAFTIFLLNSCGFYKRSDIKDNPVNVDERVKRNIEEGRGFRFGKGATRGGDFDFASSNPLWRGAVDVLDFVPLTNASYSGGIIITDWFDGGSNNNRDLKITVRFLTNEIRSDALKVSVHERICSENNKCSTRLIDSEISDEIQIAILKKAAILQKTGIQQKAEEIRKKRPLTREKNQRDPNKNPN